MDLPHAEVGAGLGPKFHRVIENVHTGERIAFVHEADDLLVMEAVWPAGGRRTVPHSHPGMEERWTVLDGRAAFRIGGVDSEGETATAPPGVVHEAWNPGLEPARVRIEMRPALRWRAFVERLFSGAEDPRALIVEFADEIRLPG
jgi:quercetin dioxygenase-like cupin family protein